jgi:putative oxidoreductase
MDIKRFFAVPEQTMPACTALLLLRVVVGLAFMFHGWGKIQNPFGWMGEDSWAPGILQALAALSEFGGGLAWVLGLLTPLASLGVASTMLVATFTHAIVKGDPFVGRGGSYELALVYLCIAMVILAAGPGAISIDRKLFGLRQ